MVQFSVVQCSTVLYDAAQFSAVKMYDIVVQFSKVQYRAVLFNKVQHSEV